MLSGPQKEREARQGEDGARVFGAKEFFVQGENAAEEPLAGKGLAGPIQAKGVGRQDRQQVRAVGTHTIFFALLQVAEERDGFGGAAEFAVAERHADDRVAGERFRNAGILSQGLDVFPLHALLLVTPGHMQCTGLLFKQGRGGRGVTLAREAVDGFRVEGVRFGQPEERKGQVARLLPMQAGSAGRVGKCGDFRQARLKTAAQGVGREMQSGSGLDLRDAPAIRVHGPEIVGTRAGCENAPGVPLRLFATGITLVEPASGRVPLLPARAGEEAGETDGQDQDKAGRHEDQVAAMDARTHDGC